jgi:hypothetical protein
MALCACLASFGGTAHAAPSGMCSNDAQSIESPPPMFPADDAVLRDCDENKLFGFSHGATQSPNERFAQSNSSHEVEAILGTTVPACKAHSCLSPIQTTEKLETAEHRWRGLRPPRS